MDHTATPWRTEHDFNLRGANGRYVGTTGGYSDSHHQQQADAENKANARHIVTACNNYGDLLAACKLALAEHETPGFHSWSTSVKNGYDWEDATCDTCNALREAIAAAEGVTA